MTIAYTIVHLSSLQSRRERQARVETGQRHGEFPLLGLSPATTFQFFSDLAKYINSSKAI